MTLTLNPNPNPNQVDGVLGQMFYWRVNKVRVRVGVR